jgi:hypothetical protein
MLLLGRHTDRKTVRGRALKCPWKADNRLK